MNSLLRFSVCEKLIKQAFTIAKSVLYYDVNFVFKLAPKNLTYRTKSYKAVKFFCGF